MTTRKSFKWDKQKVYNDNITEYSKYDFEGSIDDMIKNLKNIEAAYGNTWNDLRIDADTVDWCYDEQLVRFKLAGWRWETDEEFNTRIANQEARIAEDKAKRKAERQLKKDAEYEQYQKLKKKFEQA